MDKTQNWNLNYTNIIKIWRGGCIIQSDYISDLLERVLSYPNTDPPDDDILSHPEIGKELSNCYPSLKNVVLKCVEADTYIPSLSATLEYYKYSGSDELPTQFMEAQLDYFGGHNFDLKSEGIIPGTEKGQTHFEWKPARGVLDDQE
jgi:6-phosphogluconate dehydrogenase